MRKLACLMTAMMCSAATAGPVFFTYEDPGGEPREFVYTEGDAMHDGSIVFNSSAPVDLVVDGTAAGFGNVTYETTFTMDLTVHEVSLAGKGFIQAGVEGTFAFNDNVSDILVGEMTSGSLLTIGPTGSLTANSAVGSLSLTAGGNLLAQLGGEQLLPAFDVSFSLSDLTPTPMSVNGFDYIESFRANSAFVGSALVPAPGATALFGLAGVIGLRRRRAA